MIGPVSGSGGQGTSIDVPADGSNTVDHVRACPITRPKCFVMNTIAHSTMGNLVVGNYDLNPGVPGGVISGNAFIYNMSTHLWTLLQPRGSLSSKTTLYGIRQNGGPGSPDYILEFPDTEEVTGLSPLRTADQPGWAFPEARSRA